MASLRTQYEKLFKLTAKWGRGKTIQSETALGHESTCLFGASCQSTLISIQYEGKKKTNNYHFSTDNCFQTWTNLFSRIRGTPFDYTTLFPCSGNVFLTMLLVLAAATAMFDSVLGSTSFFIGQRNKVSYNRINVKPNLYIMFVGPPSTGKSQAIFTGALKPLQDIKERRKCGPIVVSKSTSAGLMERVDEGDAVLISSGVFDILHRMMTCASDISLLNNLFSREKVSVSLASQKSRVIETDRAFCILGALQTSPDAQLLTTLDVGNGFTERLILHFPNCLQTSDCKANHRSSTFSGCLTDSFKTTKCSHSMKTRPSYWLL